MGFKVVSVLRDRNPRFQSGRAPLTLLAIHSKIEQIGGDLLLITEKLAEKVRISGRQYFGTKVR